MTSTTLRAHAGEPGAGLTDPARRARPLDLVAENGLRVRAFCADLDRLATSRTPDRYLTRAALRFLDRDLARHRRDATEDLFPLLRRRCPREDEIGPIIAAIRADIETAHSHLPKVLAILAACLEDGRVPSASEADPLARFTRHTRRHLFAEKAILLPLARIRLTPRDLMSLSLRMQARRGTRVHDLIYGLKDGRLRDLDCSIGPGHFQQEEPT